MIILNQGDFMNIINFGSCNIDYVYRVPHFVKPGETISSEALTRFPGGKGLNQSIAIARSGAKVYHAGCIGKDGMFLKDTMEEANVDVSFLRIVDEPSGHAIIQVDESGENSIILHSGSNHMISRKYIDEVLDNFTGGDIIVLQNEINNIEYIAEKAFNKGMEIILNPSPFHETLTKLDLNKISVLILNEVEAFEFSKEKITEKICGYFRKNFEQLKVVLTLGSKGSVYFDKNTLIYCPAYSVEAKDTTSAGDTFTGYYISGMIRKMKTETILKYASAAAALAVSKQGAASSIPVDAEVEKALRILKPNICDSFKIEEQKAYITEYIAKNISNANLDELADKMKYSKSYVSVWIKKYMGTSFTSLLQDERCVKAGQLLKETDLSVDEIIKLSGYENGSFFRKIFYDTFGKSPLEYRKFYREGENKND